MPDFYNLDDPISSHGGIVVFSGGTAANSLVDVFESIRQSKGCPLNYIIPISDNGGSSSELIRVFGGPGIGDVRSRLVRLIPTRPISTERAAIANLFNHRLSSTSKQDASQEWQSLVDGTSTSWSQISSAKKQLIRSFFNLLNLEILKRSRPPTSTFDFTSASVGNLFLTAARLFSGSFESAIYLLGGICGVPEDVVRVIPAINSNFTHHIAAGLADGTVIVGQNSISHPSEPTALEAPPSTSTSGRRRGWSRLSLGDPEAMLTDDESNGKAMRMNAHHEGVHTGNQQNGPISALRLAEHAAAAAESVVEEEDANLPCSLPTLRNATIKFSKEPLCSDGDSAASLPSRIDRIWYINPYGQEISPPPNPRVCEAIRSANSIIYSIGSLYTSIIPSIVLRGVGQAIRQNSSNNKNNNNSSSSSSSKSHGNNKTTKILILNGNLDREVGPTDHPFTALDFVQAIVRAGEQSQGRGLDSTTTFAAPSSASSSTAATINTTTTTTTTAAAAAAAAANNNNKTNHSNKSLYTNYITHLIHLAGPGTPVVDADRLRNLGIQTVELGGDADAGSKAGTEPVEEDTRASTGTGAGAENSTHNNAPRNPKSKAWMRYDSPSLTKALEAIILDP